MGGQSRPAPDRPWILHVVLVALEAEAASKQSQRAVKAVNENFQSRKICNRYPHSVTDILLHIGLRGFAPGQNLGAYFLLWSCRRMRPYH